MVHHGAGLRKLGADDELVETLTVDYREANLSSADRAMLDYAVKLTAKPAGIEARDVERLRKSGFSDEAILHVAEITAYFAFANRIADGLGIELEGFWHA